jgi:predicted NUDIX family phosphoesterase
MTDEHVLCIPTDHLRAVGLFQGFQPATALDCATLLQPAQFSFRPRSQVETDPRFKQLIPYIILTCGELVFHYRRGASGTETRLRALRSIGIGGHISEADAAGGDDPYRTGMMRELIEEVELQTEYTEQFLGFINDDRTLVGSVHLGVVHRFELRQPRANSREDALADAGFIPLSEVGQKNSEFETWSQFAFEALEV